MSKSKDEKKVKYKDEFTELLAKIIAAVKQVNASFDKFNSQKKTTNRGLVLVMGNTDAGKSTTINYLLGAEMHLNEKTDIVEPVKSDEEFAKIGRSSVNSGTKLPQVVSNPGKSPYIYCDTAGFEDPEAKQRVLVSITTEQAVKKIRPRAIIIVINYNELDVTRAESFKKLVNTLSHLLENIDDFKEHIYFSINRVPYGKFNKVKREFNEYSDEERKDLVITKITELKDKIKKELYSLSINIKHSTEITNEVYEILRTYSKSYQLIKHILKYQKGKLLLTDVLVGEGCRNEINSILAEIDQTIDSKKFNFSNYDPARVDFNTKVDIKLRVAEWLLRDNVELKNSIDSIEAEINDKERTVKVNKESLEQLTGGDNNKQVVLFEGKESSDNNISQAENNKKIIDDFYKIIKELDGSVKIPLITYGDIMGNGYAEEARKQILNVMKRIIEYKDTNSKNDAKVKQHDDKLAKLKKELEGIDSDEKTDEPLYKAEIEEDRNWFTETKVGKFFGGFTKKQFVFPHKGVPIYSQNFENNLQCGGDGKFYHDSKNNLAKGVFVTTYKSDWGKKGSASVRIYVKKKDKPDYKKRIKAINPQITKLEKEQKDKSSDYCKAEEQSQRALEQINFSLSDFKTLVDKGQLAEKKRDAAITRYKEEIKRAEDDVKLLKERLATLEKQYKTSCQDLKGQMPQFRMLDELIGLLDVDSVLVGPFREQFKFYNEMDKKGEDKKKKTNESNAPVPLKNKGIPPEFICPMTGKLFSTPVTVKPCGHSFEEAAIRAKIATLKKENKEKENPCHVECPHPQCDKTVNLEEYTPVKELRDSVQKYRVESHTPKLSKFLSARLSNDKKLSDRYAIEVMKVAPTSLQLSKIMAKSIILYRSDNTWRYIIVTKRKVLLKGKLTNDELCVALGKKPSDMEKELFQLTGQQKKDLLDNFKNFRSHIAASKLYRRKVNLIGKIKNLQEQIKQYRIDQQILEADIQRQDPNGQFQSFEPLLDSSNSESSDQKLAKSCGK